MSFKEYFQYYNEYEKEYNNVVVFMEMGMFMSSYENDGVGKAQEVGKLLNLTVTYTKLGTENPQMIGFPKSSMYKYIHILLKNNYSIVWIEQLEDTKDNCTKVRKKTRVFTPGTLFEEPLTQEDYNICCVHSIDNEIHYATVIDTSVGKVEFVTLNETNNLNWFCGIYKPYELLCLCDEKIYPKISKSFKETKAIYLKSVTKYPEFFNKIYQTKTVDSVYSKTKSLNDIDFKYLPSFVCLINFIKLCHHKAIETLSYPIEQNASCLSLHNNAVFQLDITETSKGGGLFNIVNKTSTPMGCRLLRQQLLKPLINPSEIESIYDQVEKMIPDLNKITTALKGIPDLDRIIKKINNGSLSIHEIISLVNVFKNTLYFYNYDNNILSSIQHIETFISSHVDLTNATFTNPVELVDVKRDLDKTIVNFEKYIMNLTNGFDFELKLDLNSLTVTTTVKRAIRLGDLIQIKKKRTSTVDVTNSVIEQQIHDYQYQKELYDNLFKTTLSVFLKSWYTNCHSQMSHISRVIANVDVIKARAWCVVEYKYVRPTIDKQNKGYVVGEQIRHPIIECQDNIKYVANDVILNKGMLLYGINGSGKSSYGRAVALNVILAQAGFFVPAKSFTFSPYERIYTRIGCNDNLYEGMSSFWLEITEMNCIVRSGNNKSLVIGDELFKGTEDLSAMSLVSACLHWMSSKNVSFIFATHLHKLPEIPLVKQLDLQVMHMKSEYCKKTKSIIFNRTWCEGKGCSNYGIEVAEYILDEPTIINNAKMVRHGLMNTTPNKFKKSKYNANVIVDECCNCKSKLNLHTHHIQPQKEIINNKSSNLLPLCETCHSKLHSHQLSHEMVDSVNGMIHIFRPQQQHFWDNGVLDTIAS